MKKEDIINFYKQTSLFTDLGKYKGFAKKLPNDIDELCILQRMQIIHPVVFKIYEIKNKFIHIWGDLNQISATRLRYEEDYFPTAQSMLAELLRKNSNYSINREAKDKIHITCRGQAILLASILKAKGIAARARSGFATYIENDGINYDHWITEYYDELENKWKLVDADEYFPDYETGFKMTDIPYDKFIFGAEAYLGIRCGKYKDEEIYYASDPVTLGLKAAIRGLFYDFHSLMNNEIIFLHVPKYIYNKKFELSEEEYLELDELAKLLLTPNENFKELLDIWNNKTKFRILAGAFNG